MYWMGEKARRILWIMGYKNNVARFLHTFTANKDGRLSDRSAETLQRRRKKGILKTDCFHFSPGADFFMHKVVIPTLCSVVTSSIKYINPAH